MKNKLLLSAAVILFAQLSVLDVRSESNILSEAAEEYPVYIPDGRFLQRLITEGVDLSGDGIISYEEAEAVTDLNIGIENNCFITDKMITYLQGIEAFVNLETLDVHGNLLSVLDLSFAPNLKVLNCNMNLLNRIDVSNNPMLESLDCSWNQLNELDVTANPALEKLICTHNQFADLDVSQNTELKYLSCNSYSTEAQEYCLSFRSAPTLCMPLNSLDISNNSKLEFLMVCGTKFETLDLSQNKALKVIILIDMKDGAFVDVWTSSFPSDDIYLVEILCNSVIYRDVSEKGALTATGPKLDLPSAEEISVYPNPAVEYVSIKTDYNGVSFVNVSTLNGQILQSEKFAGGSHTLDISKYKKGMYLFTVRSGENSFTKKILLQ